MRIARLVSTFIFIALSAMALPAWAGGAPPKAEASALQGKRVITTPWGSSRGTVAAMGRAGAKISLVSSPGRLNRAVAKAIQAHEQTGQKTLVVNTLDLVHDSLKTHPDRNAALKAFTFVETNPGRSRVIENAKLTATTLSVVNVAKSSTKSAR